MKLITLFIVTLLAFDAHARRGGVEEIDFGKMDSRIRKAKNQASVVPEGVQIGDPRIANDDDPLTDEDDFRWGCPEGSISATHSPDKKFLSILFDKWTTEGGTHIGFEQSGGDVKECRLKIPFQVTGNYQVAVIKIDYRGYNLIPEEGSVKLTTKYRFLLPLTDTSIDGKQIVRVAEWNQPMDEDFFVNSEVSPQWSRCGQSFDFEIDANVNVDTPTGEEVKNVVDSIDIEDVDPMKAPQIAPTYHLLWQKCDPNKKPARRRAVRR